MAAKKSKAKAKPKKKSGLKIKEDLPGGQKPTGGDEPAKPKNNNPTPIPAPKFETEFDTFVDSTRTKLYEKIDSLKGEDDNTKEYYGQKVLQECFRSSKWA